MLRKYLLSLFLVVLAPALLLGAGSARAADEVFMPTAAITFDGQKIGAFDISFVDPAVDRYLLADRTNNAIDVVDTATNSPLPQIGKGKFAGLQSCHSPTAGANDCRGPNGLFTVDQGDHREVWAGDGPRVDAVGNVLVDSTVKVFDLASGALTHTIHTGGKRRADEGCLDPVDHLVLMANDAEVEIVNGQEQPAPFVTFIPTSGPQAYQVVKTLVFREATNGIEQCQWDARTGKFYLNIPEVNGPGDDTAPGAVFVIDPEAMAVERVFDIDHDQCAGPQGMAIGPDNQILLGCNAPSGVTATNPNGNGRFSTVIINDRSGAIIATLDGESGADEVWFNEGDSHYFLARSAAVDPEGEQLLGVIDSIDHHEDPSVPTAISGKQANAHSVAADPKRNRVYVPIPGATGGTGPTARVCSSAGGNDVQGCIAVFTTPNDDRVRGGQ